ncbi:hypothetical protein GCM10028805_37530 [Spirosoma harenae]
METYEPAKKPGVFYSDLAEIHNKTVVGIDLTGSEKKKSGWATLTNGIVATRTISTDLELIETTIGQKPAVISIDAPLSLPAGRLSVYDTDPGRQAFGIQRECERTLLKRGIRSYPCLIRSMQKLTERGMLLAAEFRKRGFTVIESYPGGAQDVLGIPRKSKSIPLLVNGLQSFGLSGLFDQKGVSHDELDAITSAIVGCFYLANRYEAFGNEVEGYLILPSLNG